MGFKKATKQNSTIKLAITGPSGSGKTYSALLIAKGLGGKTAFLDTESGSASLYADIFDFDTWDEADPNGFPPEFFVNVIHAAEAAGYKNLIIDSLSHEWSGKGGCLEIADAVARARYRGNSFAAWGEVTPRHSRLIDVMLGAHINIIATMRSKSDYVINKDEKTGKSTPQKVGLASIQRDGIDYEFTLMFELDRDSHLASAGKDRTHLFKDPVVITEQTGQRIAEWLTKPHPVTATVSMGMFADNLKPHFSQSQDEEYENDVKPESKQLKKKNGDYRGYVLANWNDRITAGTSPEEITKDYADILKTDAQRAIEDIPDDELVILARVLYRRANPVA